MGKKNRPKKKRTKPKRRSQRRPGTGSAEGVKDRIARKCPLPADSEPAEDVAVFDAKVRDGLAPELARQAEIVAEALQLVSDRWDEKAAERLREIPRRSPYSDWRLLIRGLVDWYADRFDEAESCWSRLDPDRRPARIAAVLRASQNGDEAAPDDTSTGSAANLVRKLRVDRPAILEARRGLLAAKESGNVKIAPQTLDFLRRFVAEHRLLEPDLVRAVESEAIRRAFAQPFSDLFSMATRWFRGPDHDPKHTLLSSQYYAKFRDGGEQAEKLLRNYLRRDLPSLSGLSDPLRQALLSVAHLGEAMELSAPTAQEMSGIAQRMLMSMGIHEDEVAVESHFRDSIRAYPQHRQAHQAFAAWLRSKTENDDLSKSERERFAEKLPEVMSGWSASLPDDAEPRLWLVDHYLETEQLDAARPHVDWLSESRQEDPRIRATPWKWELLEAMRLCRRKSWLDQVPARLDAAESLWPNWLSREWLPYLRAAYALRRGDEESYRELRRAAMGRGEDPSAGDRPDADGQSARYPLTDAIMMLGAAQRMRVPAADLKPLRAPVDRAASNLDSIASDDLIAAAQFFGDLFRTSLVYPAYRMHGSKFGRELVSRLEERRKLPPGDLRRMLLWISRHRYWSNSPDPYPPDFLVDTPDDPYCRAAMIDATLQHRYTIHRLRWMDDDIELVRHAAASETDPYFRFWLGQIVEQTDEQLARLDRGPGIANVFADLGELFGRFAGSEGLDNSEITDDTEDEDPDDAFAAIFGREGY